jgi:hypothetical protein
MGRGHNSSGSTASLCVQAPTFKRPSCGLAVRVNGLHQHERTLLRSAKSSALSVECVLPSSLAPHPLRLTATMSSGVSWQLSRIWLHDNFNGPPALGMFTPIGLYGKMTAYLSRLLSTATARCVRGSFFTCRVDYVSGRQTILRGSLGSGDNVCPLTSNFPLLFGNSYLSASCWSLSTLLR